MKLELKYLSAYLPYGLKFDGKRNGWVNFDGSVKNLCPMDLDGRWEVIKPILRPLSDLTKEIEVNGEKFVPNYILNTRFRASSKDLIPYKYDNYNLELDVETQNYSQKIDLFDGFLIVQQLLEWHFDIYGLIDAGLAIDINILNK
tara:strand:+ start:124 stop:558 length:435 start_codon:yes stop_codon:yes gene_type:complete